MSNKFQPVKFKNTTLVILALVLFGFAGENAWAADATSGVFVSKVKTLTAPAYFGTVTWEATVPANTSVKLKIRSDNNGTFDEAGEPAWSSCATEYNLTGNGNASLAGNDCLTTGHQFVQYRAELITTNGDFVPTLNSVMIAFTYPTTYTPNVTPAVDASDGDFAAMTKTGDGFYASSGKIFLKKPVGAACTVAGECAPGACTNFVCAVPPFACGTGTVAYGGQNYTTVQIGTQCWFRENLNAGTDAMMLATAATMPADPAPIVNDPNTVQKWCYGNNLTNNGAGGCKTGSSPGGGGLYTWAEANRLAATCNSSTCIPALPNQGICPTGWHIPSDAEYTTLTTYLGATTAGSQMSTFTLNGTNSSGFTAVLAGRNAGGTFLNYSSVAYFWSSSPDSTTNAGEYYLTSTNATFLRFSNTKNLGFSVRCIKD